MPSARFKYYTLDDNVHVEFRSVRGQGHPYPSIEEAVGMLRVPEVLYSRHATTVVLDAFVSYRLRHQRAKQAVSDDLEQLFHEMPQISRQVSETRTRYRLPPPTSHRRVEAEHAAEPDILASPVSDTSELSLASEASSSTRTTVRTPEPQQPPEQRIMIHQDAGPCDPESLLLLPPEGEFDEPPPPPYAQTQLVHLEARLREVEAALARSERARRDAEDELRVSRAMAAELAHRRAQAKLRRQLPPQPPVPRGVCSTIVAPVAPRIVVPPRCSSIRQPNPPLCSNARADRWPAGAVTPSSPPVTLRRIW
ncbi:hypothetical protein Q8F55_008234 [Vanrija albida]|uniref:Uncharacterized protein n=1 Tax=Vanrija albida TaxID=181172 RepID=A0ABR3PVN5_9TREE